MEEYLSQFGPIALLFAIAIREFFSYLKSKKNGNGNGAILRELQTMNNNHLESLKRCITEGNQELRDILHDDNMKIIEVLGRIDGKLSK